MTRYQKKKSVGLTAIMALVVLMAMGVNDVFADNQADTLVHEFGELLEGVEAEILSIPNDKSPVRNTTDSLQTEIILSEFAYLQAFDEVIRTQIL